MSPRHDNAEGVSDRKSKSSDFVKIMKWVGYATAILSLAGALGGIGKALWDRAESHHKEIATRVETHSELDNLLGAAQLEAGARDYPAAWKSLDDALKIDPGSAKAHTAQEDLAMKWLDNDIDAGPNGKFSTITEKLKPVLVRGVTASKPGPRQADLLAHIGWCYFLEGRDESLEPHSAAVAEYAKAVAEDADNPYAQAMWGHFLLFFENKVSEAQAHFAAALASHREVGYVRHMQLSALLDCNENACREETVRVANDMRKEGTPADARAANNIFAIYFFELNPHEKVPARFVNAVPPAEHLATFHWLFDRADLGDNKKMEQSYYTGVLAEAAGQRDEALAMYKDTMSQGDKNSSTLWEPADAGVKRLSKAK
jgi:tetratricopeptide (TPR) repeat protein